MTILSRFLATQKSALSCLWLAAALGVAAVNGEEPMSRDASDPSPLRLHWQDNILTISGPHLPGKELKVWYLEAYCRPGSTDREWGETVIGHETKLLEAADDGRQLKLRCTLKDGVIVEHVITAGEDEIDFRLTANNPTDQESLAHWAQPCIRVDAFTGSPTDDARELFPKYLAKSFIFVDGELARLPVEPWAKEARYTPGQVWRPKSVDAADVNPRPLSKIIPSNGLTGCYSADEKTIMAVAWEPYQELFQGVIVCLHSDFRLGGLKAGETKNVRGKIYLMAADVEKLIERYERDFPEHVQAP